MSNQKPSTYITILSTVLVLIILGLYGVIALHANNLSNILKQELQIIVELKDSIGEESSRLLMKQISEEEEVFEGSIQLIPKKDAVTFMQKEIGNAYDFNVNQNPFKDIITLQVKKDYLNQKSLDKLVGKIGQLDSVTEATYYGAVYEYLGTNIRKLSLVLLVLGLVLGIFAFSLIYSTIYLSLYAERFKIKTMELVGSTRNQIRKPFISKSLSMAIMASMISILVLFVVILLLNWQVDLVKEIINYSYVFFVFVGLVVFCFLINILATTLVLQKYLGIHRSELFR